MDLEKAYVQKLELLMTSYVKDEIDTIEYEIELERLDEWYQGELKNEQKS